MTRDFNDHYGAAVGQGKPLGPKRFVAEASIFRRDNQAVVHRVSVERTTANSAAQAAMNEAERWALSQPQPQGWPQSPRDANDAPGMNWNSKTKEWTPVVGEDTKALARRAVEMKASGNSNKNIARILKISVSRVRELLK